MEAPGLLVVDKPGGMTSHDVVARVRRLAGIRKVGHAGTLDPMATGVLVLAVGRATRFLPFLTGADKAYAATVRLGVSTVTDDAEGDVVVVTPAPDLAEGRVRAAVASLTGDIVQVPSSVSAVKVEGRRAYARVRAGETVVLAGRPVTVSRFDVVRLRPAALADGTPVLDADVEVACSSGTYVRALARDLGSALGVGGSLTTLRRTRVGVFSLEEAHPLDDLAASVDDGRALPLVPLGDAAARAFPRLDVDAEEARRLAHGEKRPAAGRGPGPVAVFGPQGFVAMVEDRDGVARPLAVFAG